jgi:hypothetical protein
MATMQVQTTDGEMKVDPADIDSLTYRVGEKERTVEGANILAMFRAFMVADEAYQARQRQQRQLDEIREDGSAFREAMTRRMLGE